MLIFYVLLYGFMRFRDGWNSITFCLYLGKCETETLAVIRQLFGEENMSITRNDQNHLGRRRRDEEKISEHAHHFLWHKGGLFTKNSSWQTKHTIPRTTVTLYGEWVKMCEDFGPNFGNKRTGCYITTTQRLRLLTSPGNFWPKATWLWSPIHPIFLFFPDWR
jgi:hypothetical protein